MEEMKILGSFDLHYDCILVDGKKVGERMNFNTQSIPTPMLILKLEHLIKIFRKQYEEQNEKQMNIVMDNNPQEDKKDGN